MKTVSFQTVYFAFAVKMWLGLANAHCPLNYSLSLFKGNIMRGTIPIRKSLHSQSCTSVCDYAHKFHSRHGSSLRFTHSSLHVACLRCQRPNSVKENGSDRDRKSEMHHSWPHTHAFILLLYHLSWENKIVLLIGHVKCVNSAFAYEPLQRPVNIYPFRKDTCQNHVSPFNHHRRMCFHHICLIIFIAARQNRCQGRLCQRQMALPPLIMAISYKNWAR